MERLTSLTPDEVRVLREQGAAYVGVITFSRGRRGGRFRPVRTAIFRSPEAAQRELEAPQYRTPVAARTLYLVDHHGDLVAAD